ncbi:MAG TPA: ABC transporter permease [Pseudolysinimonas sp.]|jgi:lipooligosaccharide transport system permease protein|nr:ABC transporter permease [Pseudolysinimonas sp.]
MSTSVTPVEVDAAKVRRLGALYVFEHQLRVMRNYRSSLIATAVGTPFIYLFAFGIGIGTLVDANAGQVDGVPYLTFVAPALICMSVVGIAAMEFTYPIMLGFKWNPTFIGMNSAPLSGRQIIDGIVLFVMLRMAIPAVIYFIVMAVFGAVPSPAGPGVILTSILAGLALGTPIMAYAASITEDRGQFAVIGRVVVLPLTLFSGTMFPLDQLPVFLQWIGWLSPIWHGTELGRQFTYGATEPIWLTVAHVVYLLALAIGGWRLSVRIATKRLDK